MTFKSVISSQPAYQPLPAATVPGFGVTQDFKSRIMSLTDTHIVTPNLVNEARIGFSRLPGLVAPESQIPLTSIGMRRFNAVDFPDIPQITVTGVFSLAYSVNSDQGVNENTFNWTDTISWMRGRHNLRGGLEARRYQDNYFSNNRMRGTMTISTFGDFLTGLSGAPLAQGGNGTGFSNINSSSVASGVASRADRVTDLAFFLQDDWRISSKLTVNAGIRWEYLGYAVDKFGRNGSFDTRLYQQPTANGSSAGFVQSSAALRSLAGVPKVSPTLVDSEPAHNFAPRFGLAYKITEKLIFRGGRHLLRPHVEPARAAGIVVAARLRPHGSAGGCEQRLLIAGSVPHAAATLRIPHSPASLSAALPGRSSGHRAERRGPDDSHAVHSTVGREFSISGHAIDAG